MFRWANTVILLIIVIIPKINNCTYSAYILTLIPLGWCLISLTAGFSCRLTLFGNHDWKFDRNVATTGGQAISHPWTSHGVVCWLVTCRLILASSVKITYLTITQCPRAFCKYICSAHDQLIQASPLIWTILDHAPNIKFWSQFRHIGTPD